LTSFLSENTVAATLKILPYALPQRTVETASGLGDNGPLLWLDPCTSKPVSLILSGAPVAEARVRRTFSNALGDRLDDLGTAVTRTDFVPLEDGDGELVLVETIKAHLEAGIRLIILAGETAIMDRHDIAPRAIERAGRDITIFGAPVDPGNLLLLAYYDTVPTVCVPGCARSPKRNIVDLVLPRLLVGDRPTGADVVGWGHGVSWRISPNGRLPVAGFLERPKL
jgi:hypothetical protein